ncbi:MAG: lipase family protein [Betaproteobacteria bacterium]|nr:lipase family protein [Betaproteobacteria bacterium]
MKDFENNTRAFSKINAYWLGMASKIAYANKNVIQQNIAKWGLHDFEFFEHKDTQAFIAGNDKTLVLTFRGTEPTNPKDWSTDFNAAFTAGPGGMVHEGFLIALNYVWSDIWNYIRENRKSRSLWVTGHSLGGALATLAAAKLRLEKDEPINGLYTFGQPRAGNRDFANRFDSDFSTQTFRYVNNADMVPRVPPRISGYSHVGTFRYFDDKGNEDDTMDWFDQIVDRAEGVIESILNSDKWKKGLLHHPMDRYIECLEKAAYPE